MKRSFPQSSIIAIFVFICLAAGLLPAAAQQEADPLQLKVAIKVIEPFIFEENNIPAGFSIDLWRAVAMEAELPYEFVWVESVTDQIEGVSRGEVDAAIAAISMTRDREKIVDFSHPYFDAGLQILTRQESFLSIGSLLRVLFTREVFWAMGGVVFVVILFGHLVWLFERRSNPHFQHGYLRGVWEGIWWSAVTVTTVGYGDRTPQAVLGRLLALIWMLIGLVILANFTATITTQLTLNGLDSRIQGVADLPGKRIATVVGSTSADYLHENQISFLGVETIEEAYDLLERGTIDAVVYDAPVLMYYLNNVGKNNNFTIVGDLLDQELYAIALPQDSPYRDEINMALLTLLENGTYQEIYVKWFGSN